MKVVVTRSVSPDGTDVSLTVGREYEVLGIEADWYRILDDPDTKPYGSDPVLFDPACFRVSDPTEPACWVTDVGEDGERYAYPSGWSEPGFFEDFHDGVEHVRDRFWQDVQRLFPDVWKQHRGT